jgi:hypothetical protein
MIKKQKPGTHAKKTKKENPLVLNADVGLYRPGHGLTKLGKIIKVTKSFLTVEVGYWRNRALQQSGPILLWHGG